MAESTQKTAASYEDLKTCLPGADAEFLCDQLGRKATLDQAQTAWMEEQNRRVEAARAEAKTAKEAAAAAQTKKPGLIVRPETPGKAGAASDGNPIEVFNEIVEANIKHGMARAKAVSKAVRDNPEVHKAYLEAWNASRKQG